MRLSLLVATLCCIVKVFTIVKGRYQAEITLFQYNNTPPGKCHDCDFTPERLACCDDLMNFGTCHYRELCDVYFTCCLRPFGTTGSGCSNYANVTSSIRNDTSSFSFPQQDMNVLGLPNPLLLPGLTDAYTGEGVQLYIEIWDADPPTTDQDDLFDELVDTLVIDHNEPVGEESATRVYSGMYQFVSMELIVTVKCVPGFTGPDCQQNVDDCIGVTCSGNGQCVDGVDSFDCSCDLGFTGELCQTNIDNCIAVNCSGNGECLDGVNSFTCDCSHGYTGPLCHTQVSDGLSIGGVVGGVIGAILAVIMLIVILVLVFVVTVALRQSKKQAETFELQSNKMFGVSLTTKCQLKSDHQQQEFKENREVSTKLTEQPQSDKQLVLNRNEAYEVYLQQ